MLLHCTQSMGLSSTKSKPRKGRVSKLQEYRLKELRQYGFTAEIQGMKHLMKWRKHFLEELENLTFAIYSAGLYAALTSLAEDMYQSNEVCHHKRFGKVLECTLKTTHLFFSVEYLTVKQCTLCFFFK